MGATRYLIRYASRNLSLSFEGFTNVNFVNRCICLSTGIPAKNLAIALSYAAPLLLTLSLIALMM